MSSQNRLIETIKEQCYFKKNYVNYIMPIQTICPGVISHKISTEQYIKLYKLLDIKPIYYIETRYYNLDSVLTVNKKGQQKSYKDSINYRFNSDKLRFIKLMRIPLSIEKFDVSPNQVNNISQYVFAAFELGDITLELEIILKDIIPNSKLSAKAVVTNLINHYDTSNISSMSYKLYLYDINVDVDIDKYIKILSLI